MARQGLSEMTLKEPGLRGKNVLGRVNSKSKGMEGGRRVHCVRDRKEQKMTRRAVREGEVSVDTQPRVALGWDSRTTGKSLILF